MTPRPAAAHDANDARDARPFLYVGGDPSLDLVNTVDWTGAGLADERLTDYERFTRWAEGAGVLPAADARRLRQHARARPADAAAALADARRLRDALHRIVAALAPAHDRPPATPPASALRMLNDALADALAHLRLAPRPTARGQLTLDWRGLGDDLRSPLWPAAWSAAQLLASPEAARLRVCAGPDCGWVYVDRSRNGLRRWCRMASCGTREKTRRRRGDVTLEVQRSR